MRTGDSPAAEGQRIGQALGCLLDAVGIPDFACRVAEYLDRQGFGRVAVVWCIGRGDAQVHDAARLLEHDVEIAMSARAQGGWAVGEGRVAACIEAQESGDSIGIVLDGQAQLRARVREQCDLLAPIARAVFEKNRLTESMRMLERSEQLQSTLFQIADMASSEMDLEDMLRELHSIVGRFMYAENFYIALYDEQKDAIRFIYLVDTEDELVRPPNQFVSMDVLERGLTWYVIRDKHSLMGSMDAVRSQISGPMRDIGADSFDWLGVPIMVGNTVRGVLVVQSYVERPRYTAADQALLTYVGSHILTALDRKLQQEELERRVEERTQALTLEIQERQRSVRVQETLYRIAELSHTATNLDEFYAAVHRIVGEFLDARNFYIALLSDDGNTVQFPYFVDQYGNRAQTRPVGRGISEYAMRYGKPLLLDMTDPDTAQRILDLQHRGELAPIGKQSVAWLGVPLLLGERVMGLLAVQSYTPGVGYTSRDRELLTFISYQIANGLERQRAAAELKNAYVDLEKRVSERTIELSEQIEVREQIEQRLKHEVLHDSLTGLPNRAYLRDQLVRALAHRERDPHYRFAVLFMDLDRFKVINDSVGHLVGDALLKEVARRFSKCVRGGRDMVARLGGDEFAILMEVDSPETAMRMGQRVIEALKEPVRVEGKELFTGVSVGITLSSPHYTSPEDLLRDADIAMYRAKAGGRHRIEVFDEQLHEQALQLLEVESDLRRAITRQEFEPYFQPIVRLVDGAIVGYEALIRWNHPERGVLAPGAFLHVADASGSMEAIDWQMFERTLECIAALVQPGQYVNLNFSPRHFRSQDLDERFLKLVAAKGVNSAQVRIEVTEGALLENPEQIGQVFNRLRESGVLIALDDFGTGYSSLSYLHRFKLHTVKIDRSFISDLQIEEEGGSTAVVRAILALSRAQRLEVVAEGIETEAQRRALLTLGCELGQGYLFAKPASLGAILASRGQ
ncbi:bifunctional diguanylate cyclase/phosphodiesterase [Cognatilysobacter lacus]|uniref:EAL domain-containing protein n=1 Tax=Cognatilysobacter lacus TaxID=1643323 RepID=A0A5D8ZBD4_9GAMM|nr:EAL domain-containing protein [Lysobacter lacus]TZF91432.1 EAL domain-containing protein [Lysobacter lacus]